MADRTDAELVEQTRSGDREAYGALITRYQGHVYGLAYSLSGQWEDAQDIAQETFIRAYVNLDQLREPARFAAWLRRVTFGVAVNWLKVYRPGLFEKLDGRVDLDSLEIPDFHPEPAEIVEKQELAQAVQQAIDSLPPKYRVPLTMFHLDGLSYQKVADFLDIPLGTAKSLISRARTKMKAALGAYYSEETAPIVQEVFDEYKLPAEFAHKVLAGLEEMNWGGSFFGRQSSFIACFVEILRAAGKDATYDEVMGLSGAAFKLTIAPDLCPSGGGAGVGFNCNLLALQTYGYTYDDIDLDEKEDPDCWERARAAVIASIEAGIPVLYFDGEFSLITGYREGGRIFVCKPYAGEKPGYVEMEKPVGALGPAWCFTFLRETGNAPERREAVLASLQTAIDLAHTTSFGNYASGFAAYRAWINILENPQEDTNRHGNAYCYAILTTSRKAAVNYLRTIAAQSQTEPARGLLIAADCYERIAERLRAGQECVAWPWDKSWTAQNRANLAHIMRQNLTDEEQAIAAIEQALVLMRPSA
jgi:RNA polymerase sigma-70 factor, ECF subfamily